MTRRYDAEDWQSKGVFWRKGGGGEGPHIGQNEVTVGREQHKLSWLLGVEQLQLGLGNHMPFVFLVTCIAQ